MAPLCEAVVMAAGVRVASGWPAGLNSRWLGRVNMSPFASRPSAVTPITEDSTGFELGTNSCPPEPKPLSMLPSALNRTTANAALVPLSAVASPAHASLSSDWTARPGRMLAMPRSGRAAKPPLPKVVSLVPFGRYRTNPESSPPIPTATGDAAAARDWMSRSDGRRTDANRMFEPSVELRRGWTMAVGGALAPGACRCRRRAGRHGRSQPRPCCCRVRRPGLAGARRGTGRRGRPRAPRPRPRRRRGAVAAAREALLGGSRPPREPIHEVTFVTAGAGDWESILSG